MSETIKKIDKNMVIPVSIVIVMLGMMFVAGQYYNDINTKTGSCLLKADENKQRIEQLEQQYKEIITMKSDLLHIKESVDDIKKKLLTL